MQDKDALDTFFGSICICLLKSTMSILWQHTSGKQSCKQTENPFNLAHDTLPYISMMLIMI